MEKPNQLPALKLTMTQLQKIFNEMDYETFEHSTGYGSGPIFKIDGRLVEIINESDKNKIKKWGGSRSGAGRKNRGLDLVHRAFRLRREDADTIKQVSEELGISQADVIHVLVDNYRQV